MWQCPQPPSPHAGASPRTCTVQAGQRLHLEAAEAAPNFLAGDSQQHSRCMPAERAGQTNLHPSLKPWPLLGSALAAILHELCQQEEAELDAVEACCEAGLQEGPVGDWGAPDLRAAERLWAGTGGAAGAVRVQWCGAIDGRIRKSGWQR